jgi:tRNA A-37 threonylcarbamoyl transferase component Bud32
MSERLLRVHCVRARGVSAEVLDLLLPDEKTPAAEALIKAEAGTLIWRTRLPDGTHAVVKMYRRRGRLQASRLRFDTQRVRREFTALERLEGRGVPCTAPLFWARGVSPDHGRFELLATRALYGTASFTSWLETAPAAARADALAAAYRWVRAMHASGVRHGGLSFKNLLVAPADRSVYLIDFNRSVCFPFDLAGSRMAWFDLADLTAKVLGRFGPEEARPALREYGLCADETERVLRFSAQHRTTRRLRRGLRLEFRVRASLGALLRDPRAALAAGWLLQNGVEAVWLA